jgi:hypothetical protein
MRQIAVVLVLLLGATVWRAAGGLAAAPAITPAAAVEGLQADFNNDGFADLTVGVWRENVGATANGGAAQVLYGTAAGLTGTGSQLFTRDSPGVPDSVEFDDFLGEALAASGS